MILDNITNHKFIYMFTVGAFFAGFLISWQLHPVEIKKEIKYVLDHKIEENIVEVKTVDEEVIKRRVDEATQRLVKERNEHTVTRTTIKPTGEKIIYKEVTYKEKQTDIKRTKLNIVDTKKEHSVSKKEDNKKESLLVEHKESTEIKNASKKYALGITVMKRLDFIFSTTPLQNIDYYVNLSSKLFGPISLDAGYKILSKEIGVGISVEF